MANDIVKTPENPIHSHLRDITRITRVTRVHVYVADKAISPIKLNIFRSILFSPFDTAKYTHPHTVTTFVISKINNARNVRIYTDVKMRDAAQNVLEAFSRVPFIFRFHFALIQPNAPK